MNNKIAESVVLGAGGIVSSKAKRLLKLKLAGKLTTEKYIKRVAK